MYHVWICDGGMEDDIITLRNVSAFISYFRGKGEKCDAFKRPTIKTTYVQVTLTEQQHECRFMMPSSYLLLVSDVEAIVNKCVEAIRNELTERECCDICYESYYNKYNVLLNEVLHTFAMCPCCKHTVCFECNIRFVSCPFCRRDFYDDDNDTSDNCVSEWLDTNDDEMKVKVKVENNDTVIITLQKCV